MIAIKRLRDGRLMLRVPCGDKTFRFRQGNYSCRKVRPFVEKGPFGTFLWSWKWGQAEWSLTRWN